MNPSSWLKRLMLAGILASASIAGAEEIETIVQAKADLSLGLTVPGRVAEVHVEPGAHVAQGELLISLDDAPGLARIALLTLRAESMLSEQAAEAEWKLRQVEEELMRDAASRGGANAFEVEQAMLQTQLAAISLARAKEQRQEALQQLEEARTRHELFVLRAPIDGVIDQITISEGEVIEELTPVLRLVSKDILQTDAPIPTASTLSLNRGDMLRIRCGLPGYETLYLNGRITHIAEVADAASDTRLVRLEAPNTHELPAGFRGFVVLSPESETSKVSLETHMPHTASAGSRASSE